MRGMEALRPAGTLYSYCKNIIRISTKRCIAEVVMYNPAKEINVALHDFCRQVGHQSFQPLNIYTTLNSVNSYVL